MDKNYLLTYDKIQKVKGINGCSFLESGFAWFDTEDELWDYVETHNVNVIEAFKINDIEVISE